MLKIGDFSRLARVTIKTLRFYDEAGLFHPAFVEPRTGYRFYRAEQLAHLQRILVLRELGCSVAEAAEFAALPIDSADYAQRLALLRKRLMIRVARDEQRLRRLDALLHARPRPMTDRRRRAVRQRRIPPVSALTLRDRVRSLGAEVERMFEATEQRIARHGCRAPSSPFVLFHDMEYRAAHVDVEVCVPIDPDSISACGGRVVHGVERAACVRFAGSYEQAPQLCEMLLDWMDESGTRIAGPIRETYLRFGADQCGYTLPAPLLARGVADYQTELQIPIAQAA